VNEEAMVSFGPQSKSKEIENIVKRSKVTPLQAR
jgi:hypothetical protein